MAIENQRPGRHGVDVYKRPDISEVRLGALAGERGRVQGEVGDLVGCCI